MADAYGKVKGGRLTFKGGDLATRSKPIGKKSKKKTKSQEKSPRNAPDHDPTDVAVASQDDTTEAAVAAAAGGEAAEGGDIYTIDAAKRMKYDQLFPVEAKKFRYDPKSASSSVEDALDDRVKKKADRYCK